MRLTLTPEAREALAALVTRDPTRPALRIMFAGGCGALGYRLTAASGPMAGDERLEVDGLTLYVDFKSRLDLDGARVEVGEGPDDILLVHEKAVVGGFC